MVNTGFLGFRQLNSITTKDKFPLPRIDETIDYLYGSKFFSTLDLISGYWQIEIDEQDKPKTAFSTEDGHYQFNRMPFGLTNAPSYVPTPNEPYFTLCH